MRFAYADPPYPGCAHRYPEKKEVDHAELIDRLWCEFRDGWALSTSSVALDRVIVAANKVGLYQERGDYRVAAWVKPFASFKPNVNPAYAWEPVLFTGGRGRSRDVPTVRDWFSGNITLKRGLVGAKSPEFCRWICDLLGYQDGDEKCCGK